MSTSRRPPRPRWRDFFRLRLDADPREVMTFLAREIGPFVRTRLPMHIYFASEPAMIEEVLVKQAAMFRKDKVSRRLSAAIGEGLVVSDGELWRRQRRMMQPAFHHGELQSYGAVMAELAREAVASWRPGEVRNVHEDMMALTLNIVAKLLFGADLSDEAQEIGRTVSTLMEVFTGELGLSPLTPLRYLPSRRRWRIQQEVKRLDRIVYRLIAARRAAPDAGGRDLLSLLLRARDEDGSRMSDKQLRDEALTLLVAGHETTALALTFALYLLAHAPEEQAALQTEIRDVLGDRGPAVGDLERLKRTEAVLLEAMRLYPPVWGIGREALGEVEIGGYRIPKGSTVFISQWVVHRDPKLFPEPERFQPARWLDGAARPSRFAYFPFGGGPRICIGNRFAMMEATIALAVVAQRFGVAALPEAKLDLLPTVTLRPRGGLRLRIEAPVAGVAPSPGGSAADLSPLRGAR